MSVIGLSSVEKSTAAVTRSGARSCSSAMTEVMIAIGVLAWISEGGPLGYQRIRRAMVLGDLETDCDFSLEFGFNHAEAFAQSFTWTSDKLALFEDGANVGMRVGCQNGASPRCRAFRLAWRDAAPTGPGAVVGTGKGVNLSAVGFEVVPKPNMDRRSARART